MTIYMTERVTIPRS